MLLLRRRLVDKISFIQTIIVVVASDQEMCLPKKPKKSEKTPESKNIDAKALKKKSNIPKQVVMMEAEEKTQSEKERLDSALNVMGAAPNKNLVMALLSEQEKVKKTLNFDNFGDIGISYGKGLGDDTIMEKRTTLKYNGASPEERKKYQMQIGTNERQEEEPTDENYMWNTKDIEYLAHSMMHTIDATRLTGSKHSHAEIDPYGPLGQLESSLFDRQTLLINTFISCAKTFPSSAEVAEDLPRTAEEEDKPRRDTRRLRWANPIRKEIPYEPVEYKTAEAPSDIETGKDY